MTKQSTFLEQNPTARRTHDFYETPRWMTEALLRRVRLCSPVLEPCVGEGAIANVLREQRYDVVTNDIDPNRSATFHEDATTDALWANRSVTWVVTNPPFVLADEIVPRALAATRYGGIAMLLRLSWLEPTDSRQRFLDEHPPTRLIVLPRHSFRGNGKSDSVTSAWFVWDRNQVAPKGIEIITKMERDELIARMR